MSTVAETSSADLADVPLTDDDELEAEEVQNVGSLIEQLNSAIDNVNILEDEHQSLCMQHAEANSALHCCMGILEVESAGSAWHTAAVNALMAGRSRKRAHKEVEAAERVHAHHVAEHAAAQLELQSTASWERRVALTVRVQGCRSATAAASKLVSTAKKGVASATSKEDKAVRNLHRFGIGAFPPAEELEVVEEWLALRDELEAARVTQLAELATMERRKEAAAAAVSAAMHALEVKSNEIHANRVQTEAGEMEEQDGDCADSDFAAESAESADGGDGARGRAGGHISSDGGGGDSDFVLDSASSGDERQEESRQPGDHQPNMARVRRPVAEVAPDGGRSATRATITRLLRRASDLVATSPMMSSAQQDAQTASTSYPPSSDYRMDPVHGLVWCDADSLARLRAEESTVETQHI